MKEHQADQAGVEKGLVAGRFLHCDLEGRTCCALQPELMDEISSAKQILLIEDVFHKDVFQRDFCISKSHIDLTLPFAVLRSKPDAYIGDGNSIIEFVVVMVGMERSRIHQDTPRRFHR